MSLSKVTVVIPCWNEAASIESLTEELALVARGIDALVHIVLVDDGSSDSTWAAIEKQSAIHRPSPDSQFQVTGIRLLEHSGKGVAQAFGLRHSDSASIVVFMDGDGQHPISMLPQIVERARLSQSAVIATREGYSRGLVPAVGTQSLKGFMRLLGSSFDPNLSEYMAVPYPTTLALSRSQKLGIAPIVPLVQSALPNYETFPIQVQPRIATGEESRWTFTELWKKALLQLLADPWRLLPRITLLAVLSFAFLFVAAVASAIHAIALGTSPGTVAILGAVVILAAITVGMWVASIVINVMTLRLLDTATQLDSFIVTTTPPQDSGRNSDS